MGIAGFMRMHSDVSRGWCDSFRFVGFTWARPGARRVIRVYSAYCGASLPWSADSLGLFGRALGGVGFIRVRWVHFGAPWAHSGSFMFVAFIRERLGCRQVHSGTLGSLRLALWVVGFI